MKKIIFLITIVISNQAFSDLKKELDKSIDPLMKKVVEWRHDIHQNPELSNREYRTSKKVANHLEALGIEVETKIAYTGVVGLIRGELPGPTIALRADMDALPVVEKTGLPYASKDKTKYLGQTVGIMHACGHDAHVAILMGVAEFLSKNKKSLKGNVMLIFQPAEEGPPEGENGGAKMMLEEGIFDRYKPEAIFGLHVGNGPHGYVGVASGPAMAAASTYRIKIKGVQAHGSRPWDSIDPIMATAELIQNLNTIVSRRINIVNNPAVISVGIVRSGTRGNIIPEDSEIQGTIRTFDPDLRAEIYDEIRQVASGVALGTGTEISVEFDVGGFYPVTFNDKDLVKRLTPSLKQAASNKVYEMTPSTGAEDFSFFSNEIPGMYFWLGVNAPGVMEAPGNHSPYFVVDDGALDVGLKAMVYLVEDYSQN
ncbi:MAG: M20 family metallopeptidase [Proteobacteria bacterium]|jgi:amidohydrolase|uniref:Amidohydrolase n=1 Tax=SAR86 cluster bacterium TaxID=2030880 RepID=A0A937I5J6_9GAMM|nr:amidohydrolase [SAR86 cluster bacterium]MDA0775536.1 M20 family metallopeptidase [Pseudomonadota bacterium]MDA0976365.1 M20 family metallopeptidase [Pseudomonadota bacterium]MDA1037104.1 M20 family metallopeptidase [Pseudomonadota bacterium]